MRILVPVDTSTDCAAAKSVAIQLATALPDTELVAMHVVNVRPASGNVLKDATGYLGIEPAIVQRSVFDVHMQTAKGLVDDFVDFAEEDGLKATGEVRQGAVTEQIVAASHAADLVVMGLRGESEDKFPGQGGAQATNAVQQFSVPALLVPDNIQSIQSIAVGYDCSPAAQRGLRSVKVLSDALNLPIHLIHVGGDATSAKVAFDEAVATLSSSVDIQHHQVPMGDSVHQTLVDTTNAIGADLLVLGFKGENTFKSVVFGSAREHLLSKDQNVALLVVH